MAKKGKKGFGKSTEPTSAESDGRPASVPAPTIIELDEKDPSLNPGQKALAKMRKEQADKKDDELRKVVEVRSQDDFVRENPGAAAIPEKVAMRMGNRMLPFVGIPLFGGMGAFVAFWYFATYRDYVFQPALVAGTTIAILAVSLLGITYSVMSASWDPDEEGSALGFDQFGSNVNNLKDGLQRSKENAILREKMAGLPEREIQAAIRDLDRRDEREKRRKMSLEEKLNE
eukprot:CAMPEP_0195525466 /NCGR_PEP_ID=MMETSP0794_2-20130614/25957_1 /TAXON_ID=515487 /ORGANISM="Stephanopyxis turris, Strain CCMP 815" /LENGTH=229 /DNA_ID=CAMNT_0040655945 /DNA_START=175 /DNA_END=864 /DNA_ORIENTATION=-